jgi:hypothetical protein
VQLDQVKKKRNMSRAVTSLMNRLTGEPFETTKEINNYLDYTFRNHTEEELKNSLTKAIDLLLSLQVSGKKEPGDYFPLIKLVIILPKSNDNMSKELLSNIKDDKYSEYFKYREIYFMYNNDEIVHIEDMK